MNHAAQLIYDFMMTKGYASGIEIVRIVDSPHQGVGSLSGYCICKNQNIEFAATISSMDLKGRIAGNLSEGRNTLDNAFFILNQFPSSEYFSSIHNIGIFPNQPILTFLLPAEYQDLISYSRIEENNKTIKGSFFDLERDYVLSRLFSAFKILRNTEKGMKKLAKRLSTHDLRILESLNQGASSIIKGTVIDQFKIEPTAQNELHAQFSYYYVLKVGSSFVVCEKTPFIPLKELNLHLTREWIPGQIVLDTGQLRIMAL